VPRDARRMVLKPWEKSMSTPVLKLFDLTGQHALVTGGSRGLGLQIAEALGEAGAKIMLTSRKASDLEEAAAHLQDKGIDARWIAADASDRQQRINGFTDPANPGNADNVRTA